MKAVGRIKVIKHYELDKDAVMTEAEKAEVRAARSKPIQYDEDSPELTDSMREAFEEARKKKPRNFL